MFKGKSLDFYEKKDGGQVFTRRAFIISTLQGGALCLLAGRLGWLQVAQGEKYKTLSDKNRINLKIIRPSRGEIFDRYGTPFAVNQKNFRAFVIPEQTEDMHRSLRLLSQIIELDERAIQKTLDAASRTAKFVPVEVKDNLSWEEVAKIEVRLPELPGLEIDVGERRHYPLGEASAHVVGYVGAVNSSEFDGDPLLKLPGMRIGKTGVEKSSDKVMRGKAGTAQMEVNVIGREIRELKKDPAQPGKPMVLSIDSSLQVFTQERLKTERSASAVIMDAKNGAIYALCSHPSFDPNIFNQGLSASAWEELLAKPGHPLTNKAIAGQYPPASTFKMITVLAGLKTGHITEDTEVYCPGFYDYGGDKFHCWKSGGHGPVSVREALAVSCDTFFYKLATEIGIEEIADMARRFGLGESPAFSLEEARAGLVPDKNWKLGRFGKPWQPGETIVASIGQGYLQATPLQLATMTARMVNGGHAVEPWLTGYVGEDKLYVDLVPKMTIPKAHLDIIREGMDMVVNDEIGTAYNSRILPETQRMAGKTGTAQVKRITMQQRADGIRNENLPWKYRHHGLFVGYAPAHNPRYVCSVVVEHGGGGSAIAAPIARDLLMQTLKQSPHKTKIQPPNQMAHKETTNDQMNYRS